MRVWMGTEGLEESQQDAFPDQVPCAHCKGRALVVFVAAEQVDEAEGQSGGPGPPRVEFQIRPGNMGELWPHDLCAFAVYLCTDCLKATALFNQA